MWSLCRPTNLWCKNVYACSWCTQGLVHTRMTTIDSISLIANYSAPKCAQLYGPSMTASCTLSIQCCSTVLTTGHCWYNNALALLLPDWSVLVIHNLHDTAIIAMLQQFHIWNRQIDLFWYIRCLPGNALTAVTVRLICSVDVWYTWLCQCGRLWRSNLFCNEGWMWRVCLKSMLACWLHRCWS